MLRNLSPGNHEGDRNKQQGNTNYVAFLEYFLFYEKVEKLSSYFCLLFLLLIFNKKKYLKYQQLLEKNYIESLLFT